MGIGFGLLYTPALVIVTIYFENKRSLATGITVCGSGVGTLLFSKLIGFLIVRLHEDNLLTIFPIYGGLFLLKIKSECDFVSGLILLCIPCALLFRPLPLQPIYSAQNDEELSKKEEGESLEKVSGFKKFWR